MINSINFNYAITVYQALFQDWEYMTLFNSENSER